MTIGLCGRVLRVVLSSLLASVLLPFVLASPLIAAEENHEEHHRAKIVGGYFEEWSIYFAGYNIANLQANGVADKLTHLSYAFGNATPTGCAIADPWADYQTPWLPSVNGDPYTGPLYGNFAPLHKLKHLHPHPNALIPLIRTPAFSPRAPT